MTISKIKVGSTEHDLKAASADKLNTNAGSTTQPIYFADGVPKSCTYALNKTVPSDAVFTDTKNTAGSTNTSSKIFLVGATSQAANPQTYSHDTAYVGTDGYLYSNSTKVNPRIYATLVPEGTAIPASADLNTVTYLKVGNYYCSSNATVQTLKNCPLTTYNSSGTGTAGSAFMMQVYSPLSPTFDDETTGTWRYRIRKIIHYNTGIEYTQYCYVGGTAGSANWVYGDWYVTPRSSFTFNKTATSTAAIGSATNPVYVDSTGTIKKTTYTLGASVPSGAKFTDTTYTFATGDSNGQIKVTPSGGSAQNISVKGLGSAAYTASTAYATAAQGTLASNAMPKSGGTFTGNVGLGANTLTVGGATVSYNSSSNIFDVSAASGNSATVSVKLGSKTVGSATQPIYFNAGTPTPCTYTLGKSVPSDAKFTDTTYTSLKNPYSLTIQGNGTTLTNGTYDGSAAKTVNITPASIGAAASSHTHNVLNHGNGGNVALTYEGEDNTQNFFKPYNPISGHTYSLGSSNYPWDKIYTNIMYVKDSDNAVRPAIWISSEDAIMVGASGTNSGHLGNTQISAPNGSVCFKCKNDQTLQWYYYTDSSAGTKTVFSPSTTAVAKLGSTSYRWYKLYATTACSTSSDEREKSDIMSIDDYPVTYSRDGSGNIFEKLFDKLTPKTYTLNVENSGELHIGFIAQDIANSLEELGLSTDDVALIDHNSWVDEETGEEKDRYGLTYEEFIALNTYMIQKQKSKIEEQQVQISSLEERITKLEKLVNSN